jgi:hypothetical protein
VPAAEQREPVVAEEVVAALPAAWVREAAQSAQVPGLAEQAEARRGAAQQPQGAVARVELPPTGASRASAVAAPEASRAASPASAHPRAGERARTA